MARSVGAGLERVAFENDSELIVVGSSRGRGLARTRSPRRQVGHAPSAVRRGSRSILLFAQPNIFARIGIAFDGSPESEIALAHGRILAADRDAQLILHRVLEPQIYALAPLAIIAPVVRLPPPLRPRANGSAMPMTFRSSRCLARPVRSSLPSARPCSSWFAGRGAKRPDQTDRRGQRERSPCTPQRRSVDHRPGTDDASPARRQAERL